MQPSYLVSMLDWVWARFIAAILWPVHLLAKKIVYGKIHSAIGISKVLFCLIVFSPQKDLVLVE